VTDPVDEKPKVRPWHWPREWWHDEKFWKDVASRTLSAAFAALLIFLTGLFFGYFKQPELAIRFSVALDWVIVVVLGLFTLWMVYEGYFSKKVGPKTRNISRGLSVPLVMAFVAMILFNVVDPMSQGL
jgi:fumarate reductase subunit C